ncbi:methyltransferase [Amycolatopsis keratiniphila]|uniref:methyltransferase n=1 Tax=Amycolatopsis keratiniphila TaxID=129921 RepID=UPI0033D92964
MLDTVDEGRLRDLIGQLSGLTAAGAFARVLARPVDPGIADAVRFDHAALLVFPDAVSDVRDFLTEAGFDTGPSVQSKVVRARLAQRYQVSEAELDVTIVRAWAADGTSGGLEIFALPRKTAEMVAPGLVEQERRTGAESHDGWLVASERLEQTRRICRHLSSMIPDGGGYNPHDDPGSGGRSVVYFKAGPDSDGRHSRIELTARGHHPEVLAAHLAEPAGAAGEHKALLTVLSGHWSARALHVAVEIGLADALGTERLDASEVAAAVGCDPSATARLLRYLVRLEVVRERDNGTFELTERGKLLRAEDPFSGLIQLYGNEFYDAWSEFPAAVRTGRTAFGHRYGVEHFEYFSAEPETSQRFNRSMQAVTRLVAEELSRGYPFSDGMTVIDIGGGNGTLLQTIIEDHPGIDGVVFDRAHVVDSAGLEKPPSGLRFVSGDFFTDVPEGADTYLLSRVLHDWNDEDCGRILRNCRRACASGARLLVLERLLPDRPDVALDADLAASWDLQMLAITGGQERSREEYDKMLYANGFRVEAVVPMPVDLKLLVATAL